LQAFGGSITIRPDLMANDQSSDTTPLVGVIMGSKSDWETMRHADEILTQFGVPHE
jgi:5-(carboxyamino)imidazole ribonucleotide mutase